MVYYFVTSEYFSPNALPGKPSPVSNLSKIHVKCRDKQRNNDNAWPTYVRPC